MKKKEGFDGQRSTMLAPALLAEIAAHPLCQGLYITDIGYYPNARFHHRKRKKGSPQHILIYCVQGAGWYQLHDEKHPITANQLIILPAHTPHHYGADNDHPWTIYWLHLAGQQVGDFLTYLHGPGAHQPLTVVPDEERFRAFEDMLAHVNLSFNLDNLIYANACLPRFLVSFRESVYYHAVPHDPADVVSRSIDFMKGHLAQQLTLPELAGQAGLSASHYSALFRRRMQNSPVNFFTFLKMQRACQLLENTQLRIKEIAQELGFDDPYHFTRVFTTFIGLSPRQFRDTEKA